MHTRAAPSGRSDHRPPGGSGARTRLAPAGLIGLLGLAGALACSSGTDMDAVVVVVNAASPVSVAIGDYYAEKRGLPERNRIALHIPVEDPTLRSDAHETISRMEYETQVRDPIAHHLVEHGLQNTVEIIVTTKGVPLRVDAPHVPLDTWLRDSRKAAVDAELGLLFTQRDGSAGVTDLANPYFGSMLSFHDFRERAGDAALPRYLVARLTGYVDELDQETGVPRDVRALIDAADSGDEDVPRGTWVVDADATHTGAIAAGDRMLLEPAALATKALGLETIHDRGPEFRSNLRGIRAYVSWGSNDEHDPGKPYYGEIGGRLYPGRFAPRAIAIDFVSTSARSFAFPPHYGQSLVADWIRLGIAGAGGHVHEPTLPGVHRPAQLMRRYALGATAVEAYWSSIPYLGWMNVWIGDPLMRLDPIRARDTKDHDGDGLADQDDNCSFVPNPRQRDTDSDRYGNACDADINNDGVVTSSWGEIFPLGKRGDVEWIALTAQSGIYDENHDLDGDGKVDATDVSIAQLGLYHPPGPSGLR